MVFPDMDERGCSVLGVGGRMGQGKESILTILRQFRGAEGGGTEMKKMRKAEK